MFFILSKTVAFLFMPLTIILFFLLLALFVRRPHLKKIFLWIGVGLLIFFSNDFIANEAMIMWELPAKPYDVTKKYKLGIVLTGTTMSKPYPNDRVYFNKGADRVTHTVELYKLGLIEKILISGGSGLLLGDDEPEANKYLKAMRLMGVDTTDIYIENETRNTYESAVAVKPMLDSLNLKAEGCVLITSAFHLRRYPWLVTGKRALIWIISRLIFIPILVAIISTLLFYRNWMLYMSGKSSLKNGWALLRIR